MWANGVKQIVKTTPDDSPFGAIIKPDGQRNGVRLEGTNGWIWVNRSTIEASDQAMLDTPMENPAVKLEVSADHMANFFDAVRSRKDPISPVEAGHQSAVVGHLIVIALRTGKTLKWDPADGDVRRRGCRGSEHAPGARDAQAVRLQFRELSERRKCSRRIADDGSTCRYE